tara:strand:+ start:14679 stop:17504 length:2826 start_codon:yes stop_codon:yes gene_type:complete
MKKVKPGCDLKIGSIKSKIADVYETMRDDAVFQDSFGDVPSAFRKIYENETGIKLEDSEFFPPSEGRLLAVTKRINEMKSIIKKDGNFSNGLWKKFYVSSALGDKAPEVGDLINQYIHINYEMKGRQYETGNTFRTILKNLTREAKERGFKWGRFASPKKEADKLERQSMEALRKLKDNPEDYATAKKEWDEARDIETRFYTAHEGRLFDDMLHHVETNIPKVAEETRSGFMDALNAAKDSKLKKFKFKGHEYKTNMTDKDIASKLKSIIPKEIKASIINFKDSKGEVITNNMVEAVDNHINLMDRLYDIQASGVQQFIKGITANMRKDTHIDIIKQIEEKLDKKLKPDYRTGYYPHIVIDANAQFMDGLMPHLERVNQQSSLKLQNHDDASLTESLQGLNGYLTGREKARVGNFDYSQNYLTVVKNYMDEINRFNYIAFSNTATKNTMSKIADVWNKGDGPLNGFAKSMHDFTLELHSAQTGQSTLKNPEMNAALRLMLGAEFVSKLGWNFRSAARNATQNLLNWVHFGFTAGTRADSYIRENNLEKQIEDKLRGKGLLFLDLAPELQESGGLRGAAHKVLEVSEDGNVKFKDSSMIEKAADKLSEFSQTGMGEWASAGTFMQKVENYNRKRSFKTAYSIMHKELSNNALWRRQQNQEGKSPDQIEAIIDKRADAYATNMVTMLHFDYSDVSKAAVLRNPLGKVVGQFQHYGFKFFEYNMRLLKGGKNDIMTGNGLSGNDAMRAYRMGLIYMLAPLFATALTGIEWTNLIEHDTKSRLSQLATVMTGDEDEIKAATYDRGITALVGGPFISDALRIGNLMGFNSLTDSELGRFITGYEEAAIFNGDADLYDTSRIFSGALTRTVGTTLPMALNGNPGRAVQHEFGLYQTKDARDTKKQLISTIKENTDNDAVLGALDYLQNYTGEGKKKKNKESTGMFKY